MKGEETGVDRAVQDKAFEPCFTWCATRSDTGSSPPRIVYRRQTPRRPRHA